MTGTDKIGIILQARMSSSRLPQKVLLPLAGKTTILDHIADSHQSDNCAIPMIIATSSEKSDDAIETWCKDRQQLCFRGSLDDVLSRYLKCAITHSLKHIVRLTGDNPFVCFNEVEAMVAYHLNMKSDYTDSFASFPIGVGAEVFSLDALKISDVSGIQPHHREHVNEYILENRHEFHTTPHENKKYQDYSSLRLTVDTLEDFQRASHIVQRLSNSSGYGRLDEVIQLCLAYS